MWPTMLGITSERFPKGGALALGLMGCFGNIAIYFMLPKIGSIFDAAMIEAATKAGTTFDAIKSLPETDPTMSKVLSTASEVSFHSVALVPAVLLFVFGIWWAYDKSRGGYKAETLVQLSE